MMPLPPLKWSGFGGMVPRMDHAALPPTYSELATNVKNWSGKLEAFFDLKQVHECVLNAVKTIYKIVQGTTDYWLEWTTDVDIVRSPIVGVNTRYYWSGQGEPKMTTLERALFYNTNVQNGDYTLVAGDANKTIRFDTGAKTLNLTAAATLGKYFAFVVQNNATPGGGDITVDPNGGEQIDGTSTLLVPPGSKYLVKCTGSAFTSSNITNAAYPYDYWDLGVPYPSSAPTVALAGSGSGAVVSRSYVYTWVTTEGEESAPSPASTTLSWQSGNTVDVTLPTSPPAGDNHVITKRLYRTLTGNNGTFYQFVADVPLATSAYNDSVADTALGEILPSESYYEPPTNLQGMRLLPNGAGVGFYGNTISFSEMNMLHAWPPEYELAFPYDIIAIEILGSSVVVMTTGTPYIIAGVDPAAMDPNQIKLNFPCRSKRGTVATGREVIYPSEIGLIAVSGDGNARNISEQAFTDKQFRDMDPTSFVACFYNDRYMFYYTATFSQGGYIVDYTSQPMQLFSLDQQPQGLRYDDNTSAVFMVLSDIVYQWDGDAANRLPYVWMSKEFFHDMKGNYGWARVIADQIVADDEQQAYEDELAAVLAHNAAITNSYAAINDLALNEAALADSPVLLDAPVDPNGAGAQSVTFEYYVDGVLRLTKIVTNDEPFRLPAGFKGERFQILLRGNAKVRNIHIAETDASLRRLGE